jgi:uncharacterized damage-inducible protein DinB/ubiquinone/menaquinone biosynthesis C-methylase UbiE
MTPVLCLALAHYNCWMNERVYAIASTLSDGERKRDQGAFFKSVHGTLNHLLLADRVWMGRFTGVDLHGDWLGPGGIRSLDQELHADFEELRSERTKTDAEIQSFVLGLTSEKLTAPLRYVRKGVTYEHPLWWSLSHLFNHQTHHRGQVTTLLMQAGRDPGVTDLIAMLREVEAARTSDKRAEQASGETVVPASEAYDRWAAVYDRDGNPLVAIDDAVVPALLGPVRGLHIADLACGTGRHSQRLLDGGARVTCMDFSAGMLREARGRLHGRDATFIEHDLRKPLPFANGTFDGVLCCLALEHLADLASFFREARRVCKEGAFVVCSDMHQAMRLRGKEASFDDPETGIKVRVEGYEHAVSEYLTAALGAGLSIETIQEHKGDTALLERFPRIAQYVGWPMLVAMRLRVRPHESSSWERR